MKSLAELRVEIDALDRQLAPLLARRFALTDAVAAAKRTTGTAVYDGAREQAVLAALARVVDADCLAEVQACYRRIMELSKDRQRRLLAAAESK